LSPGDNHESGIDDERGEFLLRKFLRAKGDEGLLALRRIFHEKDDQ